MAQLGSGIGMMERPWAAAHLSAAGMHMRDRAPRSKMHLPACTMGTHAHGVHDQGSILNAARQAGQAVGRPRCRHYASRAHVAQGGLDAHAAVEACRHAACAHALVRRSTAPRSGGDWRHGTTQACHVNAATWQTHAPGWQHTHAPCALATLHADTCTEHFTFGCCAHLSLQCLCLAQRGQCRPPPALPSQTKTLPAQTCTPHREVQVTVAVAQAGRQGGRPGWSLCSSSDG